MASFGLALLIMTDAALAAEPNPPVRVDIEGASVFTAEELGKALMARLPADAPAGTLHVVVRPDGSIELSWQSRRRVVDLGEDKGPAAARVAALLAADLLLPLGLPPAAPPADAQGFPAGPPASVPSASPLAVVAKNEQFLSLAAGFRVWSGALQGPLLQGAEVSAGLDRRRLRVRAGAGYLSGQGNRMVDLTAWPLRLGVGAGVSFGALLANLVMVPYRMEGLVQVSRALVGLGVEVQGRVPLFAGLAVEASAGFDAYVNRRAEVWAGSTKIFSMPASAFRFGLGLSWGRTR